MSVQIDKPESVNVIVGQAHFIKAVEDIYEAVVQAVPNVRFAVAFSEASGACKVRVEGTDARLKTLAADNALKVGCGHAFFVFLDNAYPINVLKAVQGVAEVCGIFAATANPLEILVAETSTGRGILGVIDGAPPKGVEDDIDIRWRKDLLRKIGYKL
jgi:adenosine/AMP kinase